MFSTARSERIVWTVFAVGWAGFAAWALADGRYISGAFYMAFTVIWALYAVFVEKMRAFRNRRRTGR